MSARSRRRSTAGRFTMLPHSLFMTAEFAALSPRAVKLLLELWMQFNGSNNGDLCCAWSLMRKRSWTSKDQLAKALAELEATNWILRTRQGSINKPSLYAVTFKGIDGCGGKLDVRPDPKPSHAWRSPGVVPKSARRVRRLAVHRPARRAGEGAPRDGSITSSIH